MVSVLTSVVLDRKFQTRLGQPKDYDIGTCCFSVKREALRFKSKDWMAFNLLTDCCFSDLALYKSNSAVGIVQSEPHHYLIEK